VSPVSGQSTKVIVAAELVKLLYHRREDRGMTLIPERSRCVRTGEVHELVVTDHRGLRAGDRVDRVGFLGFAEVHNAGVLDAGDEVSVEGRPVGVVAGFDECHFPNHYNIIIAADELVTATELDLKVGQLLEFTVRTPLPEDG
jgi:hypothetical protein